MHAGPVMPQVPLRYFAALTGLVALSCLLSSAAAEWHSIAGGRYIELPQVQGGAAGFKALDPSATGIHFTNTLSEEAAATNRTLFNGSGVATGDVDGDGLPDIVFAGLNSQLELYRNLGGFHFSNVTREAGLLLTNAICRGVVLADVTGDGALDLLLTTTGSGVRCWRNDGHGHFTDMTAETGLASSYGSMTLALADVNGDGALDLYVANNRAEDIRDRGQVLLRSVRGQAVVPPALTNRLVIINGQLMEYGEPDFLYLNDGTGHFRKVDWAGGTFLDEAGHPLHGPPLDWGLSATLRDFNGDGAPDLYVCNDFWTPDRIWINNGRGTFKAAPPLAFRKTSGSSMGVDLADLDGDGWPEIFVVDMLSRLPSWRKRQMSAQPAALNLPGEIENRPQSLRNTLFHSRRDGSYEEIANFAGLAASEWAWQPFFMDVDLDGQPDLLIPAGHAHDVQDRDASALINARQKNYGAITNAEERRRIFTADLVAHNRLYPPLATPIVAFRNTGRFRFEDVTANWGTAQPGVHHGIAFADFDGDGDLDFVVNNMGSAASVYRNDAPAPRIAVRLKGKSPNTQAIGSLVTLEGGAVLRQSSEVVSGGRYLSGTDPLLVFASGTSTGGMKIKVRWRSGATSIVTEVGPNRLYEIIEPSVSGQSIEPPNRTERKTWFADETGRLAYVHHDELYDDFFRQPLLPRRISQAGPGVAWCDLDGDGWEDLVIGTGRGGRLGAFRNDRHGSFSRFEAPPFNQPQARDTAGLVSLPSPQGDAIMAATANYEDGLTNAACLLLFQPGNPAGRPLLKDMPSSAGALALGDYDGDGNLDLLVTARVLPGRWPEAGGSLLLKQQNGAWVKDAQNSETIASSNAVTAGLWTDLNQDGFPELVLVGEFSAPKIFRNEHGRLASWNPAIEGADELSVLHRLSDLTGLWSSVTAADFDGDGALDLVLGNWGENGEEKATPDRPLTLWAGDFGNGSLSLIETVWDPARNALTPDRPLPDLVASLPFLSWRFRTHRDFSEASLDQVLGPEKARMRNFSANTLKSLVLLNRGDHFLVRPLPLEAQFAPVFGICAADFDLDGRQDLFLAQNFFATRPGIPRLDAGRGLMLKGDGQGSFSPISGNDSGILVYGEQRGAAVADFDHDGRPDLVVTQNAAQTRLYRNLNGAQGVQVRLHGPPGNPNAIGAVLRAGLACEIHAGSGYWSQDAPTILLPPSDSSRPLEILWPGGKRQRLTLPAGQPTLDIQ